MSARKVRHKSDNGLTLLELLLAMVLMAVIMTLAWNLLAIFRGRLESSQQQTEQWQLIRSLQHILADDLRSCQFTVPDERHPQAEDSASSVFPSSGDKSNGASNRDDAPTAAEAASNGIGLFPSNPELSGDRLLTDPSEANPSYQPTSPTDSLMGSATTTSDIDGVIRGTWLEPQSVLVGTSQALLFDLIPPAAPEGPQPPASEPLPDQATIPDTVRRVVYIFNDPQTAAQLDRIPGFVRCELTMWQMTTLRQHTSGDVDLLTWLRPEISALRQATDLALAPPVDPTAISEDNSAPARTKDDTLEQMHAQASMDVGVDLHLADHLDYVPELASFALRYYDGTTWLSQWDSRQLGRLPVAIELRFQLTSELPSATEYDGQADDSLSSELDTQEQSHPQPTLDNLAPQDDRLRSAQTKPPEDHRFLIFLRSTDIAQPPTTSLNDQMLDAVPSAALESGNGETGP